MAIPSFLKHVKVKSGYKIHFCGSCVGRIFISDLGVFLIMHTVKGVEGTWWVPGRV